MAVIRRADWCVPCVHICECSCVHICVCSRVYTCVCSTCTHMCVPIEHVFAFQMLPVSLQPFGASAGVIYFFNSGQN